MNKRSKTKSRENRQRQQAKRKLNSHMHHEVFIDWKFYNKLGPAPMLCCKQCVTTHGPRRGQPQFIKWVSDWELIACRDAGVEENKIKYY